MKKKQRKRMISLVLAFLLLLSSFTPYVVCAGGPAAGSNDSTPDGERKPAEYNMHGWGMMVTLYKMNNMYKNKQAERDKIGTKYAAGDKTSTVINIQTADKFLKDFPEFWLSSGTAARSALIFNASNDKYNEWTSGSKPTNKFVGKDGTATMIKAKNCYAVNRNQAAPSSLNIKVVADEIKSDEKLLKKFLNREMSYSDIVKLLSKPNVKQSLAASKKSFLSAFCQTGSTAPLLNDLVKGEDATENALQYLDVLLTVKSLLGENDGNAVKAYLRGLNQDDADEFVLVAIAAVASNSDDTWLWYTIPSWYKQFIPGTAEVLTSLNLGSLYSGMTSQNDYFFNAYEATVTSTTSSGNAASLKKHRAWAWWHKKVSEYSGGDITNWAFSYMPTDRKGQKTGNIGYTFFGQVDTTPDPEVTFDGTIKIYRNHIKWCKTTHSSVKFS